MQINSVRIHNFKGIEQLDLKLDPRLNILIGDNGSGKTAILEALTIAVGTLFMGMKNLSSRSIGKSDVRYTSFQEYAYPVSISAAGQIYEHPFNWSRSKNSQRGSTTKKEAQELIDFGRYLDEQVRSGQRVDLPLISYFSTSRLFVQAKSPKNGIGTEKGKALGSRYRGYRTSLSVHSNFQHFLQWFKYKELSVVQKRQPDLSLDQVRTALVSNLPGCKNIYFDFDPDTNRGLTVELTDGRVLPFTFLSDGMRNYLAMVADIAHRCVVLNPHLGERALEQTKGIVLIDELDLHLHPSWQKAVVNSLRKAFPSIQFIITTHSPYLIQEAGDGQLVSLAGCQVKGISGGDQLSLEDIAEYKQGVENPQWSRKKQALYEATEEYLGAVEAGETIDPEQKQLLQEKLLPFSANPAIDAMLKLEELKREKT